MNTNAGKNLLWRTVLMIAAVLLVSACLNPLADHGNDDTESVSVPLYRDNTGGVRISIGESGLSPATILPDTSLEDEIEVYDVILTEHSGSASDVFQTGLSITDFPVSLGEIETGDWTLVVSGRDGEGEIVGAFTDQITVTDGDITNVNVTIRGVRTEEGAGRLEYTLSWPEADADGWEVEIVTGTYSVESPRALLFSDQSAPDPDFADAIEHSAVTLDAGRRTLSLVLDPIESGTYVLVITLWREDADNAPIIEAAQVYDNRTSSKTVELAAGALTQPPPPPENFTAVYQAGTVQLSWDPGQPNTAIEFEIMRGETFVAMPEGFVTSWVDDDETLAPGETYTYTITAFNNHGVSAPVSATVTIPIPVGDVSITISFDDPVSESFSIDVSPEGPITRGTAITVNFSTDETVGSLIWLLNGTEVTDANENSFTISSVDSNSLPLGVNRISVLLEIDGNWYSSEDMTFEVVQP